MIPILRVTHPYLHYSLCSICRNFNYCKKEGCMHVCEPCDVATQSPPTRSVVVAPQGPQWGSPHADYRIPRPSRHLKLRLWGPERGSAAEKDAKVTFHGVLKELFDSLDYPIDPFYKPTTTHPICSVCGGLVWYVGNREPKFLRRLAKQLGLRIAVDQWRVGSKCPGWEEKRQLTGELEGSLL
jgi:hypothetical protein